ncbi:MAG: chemotaxis protein CheB [Acidobacteria bacterium]|nr:chemotaxis protein CheB [Acidobacteriota bacterium]
MAHEIVVIGGSRGGTRALGLLLGALPGEFALPVAVALHRGKESGETLVQFLQSSCRLPVGEAQDKQELGPARVYLAPAGYHLLVERDGLALSTEGPVCWARPSIDVLFESAADTWGVRVIGVILTGANSDGARGLARIKKRGGLAVVQEPEGAECRIMPDAAIEACPVDRILPVERIAPLLAELALARQE